ncbi:MAG TPA: DUF2939 domain-containing protein [Enterovirga sp.]|jgi:hypothetical protein|nr:DUF2939 domain-containing protein [Enterovirga sp.]
MRWFVSAAVALLLVWAWYMASPYVALWDLGRAIEQRNVARLSDRVNVHAVRVSLARQVAAEEVGGARGTLSPADRQAAAAALAALADPVMQRLLTPGGILDLLRASADPDTEGQPHRRRVKLSSRSLTDLIAVSRWRGFRNVYFALPPEESPERRFRLQFRLARMKWRLISVDLPEAVRQRLAGELLRRVRAEEPEPKEP